MQQDPEFVKVLRQLANGEIEPEEWVDWWNRKSEWVASVLNRGQWLRLKSSQPGAFGPASRCAFVSQSEACALLDKWGVEYKRSNRYEEEWEAHFEEYCAQERAKEKERQKRFRPILKLLAPDFRKCVWFLRRNLEIIESMEAGASDEEIAAFEASLGVALPDAYRGFLKCCRSMELGEALKLGLPNTFVHESPAGKALPTDGLLCFGECWLEGDGDQVLFGKGDTDPPVFYYAHEVPELRQVAGSFIEWVEGIPKWDSWEV